MKLGDILRDRAQPIKPRPVKFWVAGRDEGLAQVKAQVSAVLAYISEDDRARIRVEAIASLRERFKDKEIPSTVLSDEILYRKLFLALRDEEPTAKGTYVAFCDTLDELRRALTMDEVQKLENEYDLYLKEEFPPSVSDEDWKKMLEDAEKNSARDLLTSYGFESAVRVLSSLAGRSSR